MAEAKEIVATRIDKIFGPSDPTDIHATYAMISYLSAMSDIFEIDEKEFNTTEYSEMRIDLIYTLTINFVGIVNKYHDFICSVLRGQFI